MDARSQIGLLLVVYAVQVVVSAPTPAHTHTWYSAVDPGYRVRSSEKETGRIFWSAVGDVLEALPFLPLTINVPDVITGMWNFLTGFFPGSSGNKKPKGNSTSEDGLTRDDLIDYFLY